MFWILDELINEGNAAIVQNRGANPQDPYIYQWATQVSLYLQKDTDLGMLQERAMGLVDDVLGGGGMQAVIVLLGMLQGMSFWNARAMAAQVG